MPPSLREHALVVKTQAEVAAVMGLSQSYTRSRGENKGNSAYGDLFRHDEVAADPEEPRSQQVDDCRVTLVAVGKAPLAIK